MTLRPHAAFASACGSKERATRALSISELKIWLLRYTRRDSLRDRLSGKRISSTVRNNLDKGGSGIANADYFNPVARNLASLTRIKLLCKSAADAEYAVIAAAPSVRSCRDAYPFARTGEE